MLDQIEVTVTAGEREIRIKGPKDFVTSEVQRLTNMLTQEPPQISTLPPMVQKHLNERDFVASKRPHGHPEIVAVLGYLLEREGASEFSPDDIRRAYARAAVRPPKNVDQAVRDSKNLRDYLERGSEKGTFRLSVHGRRTVEFDLPRRES